MQPFLLYINDNSVTMLSLQLAYNTQRAAI